MATLLRNVRSQGQSGKHVLVVSFSGFDPTRTSRAADRYDTDEPLGPEGIARLIVPEGAA